MLFFASTACNAQRHFGLDSFKGKPKTITQHITRQPQRKGTDIVMTIVQHFNNDGKLTSVALSTTGQDNRRKVNQTSFNIPRYKDGLLVDEIGFQVKYKRHNDTTERFRNVYTYDDKGRQIAMDQFTDKGVRMRYTRTIYDHQGFVTATYENDLKTAYVNDAKGNHVRSIFYNNDKDSVVVQMTYDENNNKLEERYFLNDTFSRVEAYKYNEHNMPIEVTEYTKGVLRTKSNISNEYDVRGNPTKMLSVNRGSQLLIRIEYEYYPN